MKLRIANIGISVTHDTITNVSFPSNTSVSDFDALIFNPPSVGAALQQVDAYHLVRRESEFQTLLEVKAGVILAHLTPATGAFNQAGRIIDSYYLLDKPLASRIGPNFRSGSGISFKLAPTATSSGRKYFRALEGHLQFEGYLAFRTAQK
jgi:hypothetical protein